jgi:hypothetical protein
MTKGRDAMQIQARVSELLSEYRIPSAAIGVLHDGEITDFAAGVKNLSTEEPATTDTIYQCGSMTKTWTALAFMQLVAAGKVGLDEPVRTYLPGFKVADPEVSAEVTPRHLLNHTNGIEEDFGDPGEDDDVYERMVDNIASAPQVHHLGYTHGYSAALGYAILARIMEVTCGKRWDDIMKDRLFDPLGLTGTSSWREQVDQDRAATGHLIRSLEEGPIVSPLGYLPRAFGPGGNVNSTAREVLTMAHVFLIVCDWHGETVYAHDGSTVGQSARLRILPDSNIALSMLANGGPRDSFYKKVFNAILADLGAATIPDLPKPDPTLSLDSSKYEGAYERPGVRYEVEAEGRKLSLTFVLNPMQAHVLGKPERIKYELLPISETHFLMPSDDPLEDTQTVAIYDFKNGVAQYLHTNCRVNPRVSN